MRRPLSLEEFAELVDVPADDIRRYRDEGLLDVDSTGTFNELDALRIRFILIYLDRGETLDDFKAAIRDTSLNKEGFGEMLWPEPSARLTPAEAATKIGISVEQLQALRMAIGLPGDLLSEDDLTTFQGVKAMIDAGFPFEAMLEGARVLGDSMRRFAETEMRLTHQYLHEPLLAAGASEREVARQAQDVIEGAVLPVMDPIILGTHRQYVLRAVVEDTLAHLERERPSPGTMEATMMFVDLTSFTSLAHVHGDLAAAEVLDRFDGLVRSIVFDHGGKMVKQIGDAFMLAFSQPSDAVVFAVALAEGAAREESFPEIRIGIHSGPVLFRVGDYVGSTVNIASRVSTMAAPGEILMTKPVAEAAEKAEIPVQEAGVRMLRGVSDPLSLYRVVRGRREKMRDPVCGLPVGDEAFARIMWAEEERAFHSEDCLRTFLAEPHKYV